MHIKNVRHLLTAVTWVLKKKKVMFLLPLLSMLTLLLEILFFFFQKIKGIFLVLLLQLPLCLGFLLYRHSEEKITSRTLIHFTLTLFGVQWKSLVNIIQRMYFSEDSFLKKYLYRNANKKITKLFTLTVSKMLVLTASLIQLLPK